MYHQEPQPCSVHTPDAIGGPQQTATGEGTTVNTAQENMLPQETYRLASAMLTAAQIGWPTQSLYTDQAVSDAFDVAAAAGALGAGGNKIDPKDLWGGGRSILNDGGRLQLALGMHGWTCRPEERRDGQKGQMSCRSWATSPSAPTSGTRPWARCSWPMPCR